LELQQRWTRLGGRANGDLVLAVDFDGSGRKEATFRDLARLLPGHLDVWHAVPPPGCDRAPAPASRYLQWWEGYPRAGRVFSVLGYCAGSVFACALADDIESRQGLRPRVLLFNPGPPTTATLNRDFRAVVNSMTILDDDERGALHRRADEARERSGDDFDVVRAQFAAMYAEACGLAFARFGIDPDVGRQLTGLFHSYVSYLAAARQVTRDPRWDSAVCLTSREHAGTHFTSTEIPFDLIRTDLLASSQVAGAVGDLLAGQPDR
jgi:hypothetical protein